MNLNSFHNNSFSHFHISPRIEDSEDFYNKNAINLNNFNNFNNFSIINNQNSLLNFQDENLHLFHGFKSSSGLYQRKFDDFTQNEEKDKSDYSIIDQNETNNLMIDEIDEKKNDEKYMKIGKDDENIGGIEPIKKEVDYYEGEQNDSFFHEGNFLFQKMGKLNEVKNDSKIDMTIEEEIEVDLSQIKKNLMCIKLSKSSLSSSNNNNTNESSYDINNNLNCSSKKGLFNVSKCNNNDNYSNSFSKSFLFYENNKSLNANLKFTNSSLNISDSAKNKSSSNLKRVKKRKGRKRLFIDGIKTEIVDKAYIREFRKHLRKNREKFRSYFDEEPGFWGEFLEQTNPPFCFRGDNKGSCGGGGKRSVEFKSYSQNLMKFLFGKSKFIELFRIFVKEKEHYLFDNFIKKSKKNIPYNSLMFYKYYGKNLHIIYSDDFSVHDINCEEDDNKGEFIFEK